MANAHTGFGIQPVEINRDIYANYHTDFGIQPVEINRGTRGNGMMTNEVDIEHLAAFRASQLQQSRSAAVLQQKPDSRYIQGKNQFLCRRSFDFLHVFKCFIPFVSSI
ncbi:unnamed protein product [Adineta steineri]|uniref:Uncharacterized protein n=1 Tax=Adineta steineri TaxID=433720 RepID=A0A815TJX4_9BILA|nr:unnamed protein product [Adineta steineri]